MASQDKDFRSFLSGVAKKYGDDALVPARRSFPKLQRATWGNLLLDIASGGGFARGRIHRILGPESSGKSQTPLTAFSANQHLCNVCWLPVEKHLENPLTGAWTLDAPYEHEFIPFRLAWIDAETSTDLEWIQRHGVNLADKDAEPELQSVFLSHPSYAEEALDLLIAIVRARHYSMVVFDSIGAISSTDEIEKSTEDAAKMAETAKLLNRTMRILMSEMSNRVGQSRGKPAVFLINHVYAAMDQYGPKEFIRGGRGQAYASSFDLFLERREYMLASGDTKGIGAYGGEGKTAEEVVKQLVRFQVRKSKICSPGRSGEYWSYIAEHEGSRPGNVDCGASLIEYGERYGVIVKSGLSYVRKSTGEELETARPRLAEKIAADVALQRGLAEDLLAAIRADSTAEVEPEPTAESLPTDEVRHGGSKPVTRKTKTPSQTYVEE